MLEQVDDQGMGDEKAFLLLPHGEGFKEDVGVGVGESGSKHVKSAINHQLQKFTPLGFVF